MILQLYAECNRRANIKRCYLATVIGPLSTRVSHIIIALFEDNIDRDISSDSLLDNDIGICDSIYYK